MTRRRLIWALVAFVVAFTVAFLLSGEARADVLPSPAPRVATGWEIAAWILAGLCVLVYAVGGVVGLAFIVIAGVGRLWDRRPAARRADAFNQSFDEAVDEAVALASPGYVTRVETQICNELWALPTVDEPRITP